MNTYSDSTVHEPAQRKILIFDTTLRDGEQSALCTMFSDEKLKIARALDGMGVDIIEAGFAVSSKENFEIMRRISKELRRPYLCGLARSRKEDIDATYQAYKDYDKRMIHIFFPTSKVHLESKMKKSNDEILDLVNHFVSYAKGYFPVVEFTAEDAVRTENDFLKQVYTAALNSGADVINIADTTGCAYPRNFGEIVRNTFELIKEVKPAARVSVHCHNDLGLALANTLEGIENGASQVECTVNGIGERAGNCALEQVVASSIFSKRFSTGVDSKQLYEVSRLVSQATGVENPIAPVVGEAVFAHKAGIHQHGVLNNKNSYEVLRAEDFGRKSEIILGPHSGYHGAMAKAKELGLDITKEQAARLIEMISEKVRNYEKKRFSDEDVMQIAINLGFY
jgi:2-isopropylmalate synthase